MSRPLRLVVLGCEGRMGRRITALAADDPRFELGRGVGRGDRGSLAAALNGAQVAVDFSAPKASLAFAAAAAAARVPIVIGTTGFTPAQLARLRATGRRNAVVLAPNMSPGMNILFELSRRAAAALRGYDAAVSELHHALKKDAPSGSALRLAEAVRAARGPRSRVAMLSLRAGGVIGDHTVIFAGPEERLELSHRAQSRDVFARGALAAAFWLAGRKPGVYGMGDVLGL